MDPLKLIATPEVAELLDLHLGKLRPENPCFKLEDSPISGRGVFATRDIAEGEEIFREPSLLVGPTAHKSTKFNTCTICYRLIDESKENVLCPAGCTLPVCVQCSKTERHLNECKLFQKWVPKDKTRIDSRSLRVLSVVRCCFLSENQRKLLYAMQANPDKYYMNEIKRASECFENFPQEKDALQYFYRSCCAFNTNAFESRSRVDGHEILVRGLFPLGGMLNHQCTPNASHYSADAETLVIIASRPIKQGEEITTSYAKILWSNLSRKLFLFMTKHFICKCTRCQDPTENGTYLAGLFCREQDCKGIVIPVQTKTMQPDWHCIKCGKVFPHSKMARYQDFALNTINNRINTSSIREMIRFINELCPRFCPSSNYVLIEAKLNVIWRMSRIDDDYTAEELQYRDQYRDEILDILKKLGAGECTLKRLINEENEC